MTAIIAEGARHIRTFHQDPVTPWHWWALRYGISQPRGYRNRWHNRRMFRLHFTPIYLERWGSTIEFGFCLGRRTLYVVRHR